VGALPEHAIRPILRRDVSGRGHASRRWRRPGRQRLSGWVDSSPTTRSAVRPVHRVTRRTVRTDETRCGREPFGGYGQDIVTGSATSLPAARFPGAPGPVDPAAGPGGCGGQHGGAQWYWRYVSQRWPLGWTGRFPGAPPPGEATPAPWGRGLSSRSRCASGRRRAPAFVAIPARLSERGGSGSESRIGDISILANGSW